MFLSALLSELVDRQRGFSQNLDFKFRTSGCRTFTCNDVFFVLQTSFWSNTNRRSLEDRWQQHKAEVCRRPDVQLISVSFSVHVVFSMMEAASCMTREVSVLLLSLLHPVAFFLFHISPPFVEFTWRLLHPSGTPSSHSYINSFSVAFILCMFCWMCMLAIEGSALPAVKEPLKAPPSSSSSSSSSLSVLLTWLGFIQLAMLVLYSDPALK